MTSRCLQRNDRYYLARRKNIQRIARLGFLQAGIANGRFYFLKSGRWFDRDARKLGSEHEGLGAGN
jgi:hypothetical protein